MVNFKSNSQDAKSWTEGQAPEGHIFRGRTDVYDSPRVSFNSKTLVEHYRFTDE